MISWIQRTFQQHFKWLFLSLLIVVIISFVFITNASSGLGHTGKQTAARPFFGLNLGNPEDTQALVKDATLMRSEGQFQQYALQRQAALHLAGELNLPAPTNEQLAAHIQTLPAFTSPEGVFDAKRYADFRDSLKTNPQLREADVTRVLADDVTYQQVLKLLAGPGYVLPADVQNQLNRINASWTLQTVTIDYESYKPAITVTDEALSQFFEYNAARYQIAPKVGVSYVDFPAAAYTSQVTATEEGLQAYFEANKGRFATKPDATFASERAKVEEAYKLERAQARATAAASDLAVAIYEAKVTAATLPDFLASRNLTVKRVAPFNSEDVPAELGGSPRVAVEALKTGPERLVSDPVGTGRGSALLIWNETVPTRTPALAEIKERVTTDYRESEKRKRFADAGRTLRAALEARIQAGDTFEKAVASSSGVIPAKLETKKIEPFTLATPPQDIDYTIYSALETLQKGQLSPMLSSLESGIIVYAADKQIPSADPSTPQFASTKARIAAYTASRNGGEILASLVEAELAKSEPATP
jgi:peptidyl-prolyl cis-trans isomerase D